MHDNDILPSKSLGSNESHDCNLTKVFDPFISREACDNSSGVEKIDGSEFETRILFANIASLLKSKVTFDPTLVKFTYFL